MEKIVLVAGGGAIGAVLRFLTVGWAARMTGETFWGTMAVNVLGSFAMGVAAVVLMERFPEVAARLGPLAMVGILGGFTTFSAFSFDAVRLLEEQRIAMAGSYLLGSVVLSVSALACGIALARGAF